MTISIFTLGTRGDVQPYAILGQALVQNGHEVRFCTAKNFESLVQSYGLKLIPIEADFQALLESADGKKMMKGNPWVIRQNLHSFVYPLIENSLTTFYHLAQTSDCILYHVKTLGDTFADQFPEKMIRASVLPIIEETQAFPIPALSGLPIPSWANKLSYRFSDWSMKMLAHPIKKFRQKVGLPYPYSRPPIPNLYGISSHFLPIPPEYAEDSFFSGFWFDPSPAAPLSSAVEQFLEAGDPPLVITFGSMPWTSSFSWKEAIETCLQTIGIRIILIQGWGGSTDWEEFSHPDLLVIREAPHDALFPRVKAIVHHGGIGTTAACLRAGKPFWICPILYPIGDQLFWGKQAYDQGLAIPPKPLKKVTVSSFVKSIRLLIQSPSLDTKAQKMQALLAAEHGTERAVQWIEQKIASSRPDE